MRKARVMIVDDSVVIRRLLTEVLSDDPGIEIAATAANGRLALGKLDSVKPDAIVLDIEMPELDGLGTLLEIRKRDRHIPIIMFSTLTARGAESTMEALARGASDYVTKPANMGSVAESRESARTQLIPRILTLVRNPTGEQISGPVRRTGPAALLAAPAPSGPVTLRTPSAPAVAPRVLVIGCSTGGPDALAKVVSQLPANIGVPILVVQHMPPVFTTLFAERLNRSCPLAVTEARDNVELRAGHLYLAPGNFHLEITASPGPRPRLATRLTSAAPENFCRPAVDVLFRSAAAAFGPAVLATVLTGMGTDGKIGSQAIVNAGGHVIVQDQQSSVVWGMPGSVASAGLAEAVLPLSEIASNLLRRLAQDQSGQASSPGPARSATTTASPVLASSALASSALASPALGSSALGSSALGRARAAATPGPAARVVPSVAKPTETRVRFS